MLESKDLDPDCTRTAISLKLQGLSLRDKGLPASICLGLFLLFACLCCSICEMQSSASGTSLFRRCFLLHDLLFRIRIRIDRTLADFSRLFWCAFARSPEIWPTKAAPHFSQLIPGLKVMSLDMRDNPSRERQFSRCDAPYIRRT